MYIWVWYGNVKDIFQRTHRFRELPRALGYDVLNWFAAHVLRWKCECAWVIPYGFVRECDCAQHDKRPEE